MKDLEGAGCKPILARKLVALAHCELGDMHYNGRGVEKDLDLARDLFEKAASEVRTAASHHSNPSSSLQQHAPTHDPTTHPRHLVSPLTLATTHAPGPHLGLFQPRRHVPAR